MTRISCCYRWNQSGLSSACSWLWHLLLACFLWWALPAQAASYAFPGSLPATCSGSGVSYTCGSVTLASGDTVSVANAGTTISFTAFSTNNAQINVANVSNLTLTISGTLTVAGGATIKANITAGSVSSSGAVTYVGSLTTTGSGAITLGAGTTVSGLLTTSTGAVTLLTGTSGNYTTVGGINAGGVVTINSYNSVNGSVVGYLLSAAGNNTINGSITATSTYVSLGGNANVGGSIYAQTYVDTGSNSSITGSITSATSYIDTGTASSVGGSLAALGTYVDIHGSATVGGAITANSYVSMTTNSSVGGNVTAKTTIALGSGSTVAKCVRSSNANSITVPSATAVGGACCGAGSTCTSTCVSGTPKPATCSWPDSGLVAEYRFEETSYNGTPGEVLDSSGNKRHGKVVGSTASTASGKICRGIFVPQNLTSVIDAFDTGIDANAIGNSGTVAFWYKSVTSSHEHRMLFDATTSASGKFYLYRDDSGSGVDLNAYITDGDGSLRQVDKLNAMSDATWTHIAVTWKFTTGSHASRMILYVNGVEQDTQTYSVTSGKIADAINTIYFGDNRSASSAELNSANGYIDQVKLYDAELTASEVASVYAESPTCTPPPPHHMEVTTSSATGPSCVPVTYTIRACADASCSSTYTSGVTGNLVFSGTPTVTYTPAFSITPGNDSTTVSAHVTSAGSVTAGLSGLSVSPSDGSAPYCGMGGAATAGGSCVYTATASALLFDVPHHDSETSQAITVRAVRSSDNATVCTPAFANVSKNVTFKCSYSNPTSGYVPVRVGGVALNASSNSAAACDGTGGAVSLSFDGSGAASTLVQYADVGQMVLSATYTGSGSDAGLTVSGSDTFIAAPSYFVVSGWPSGNIKAGAAFSADIAARNHYGGTTRNFGREISPASASVNFMVAQPSGGDSGAFIASLGAFSDGIASSNMSWSEVGRGDVSVLLSGTYLGSGFSVAGNSANADGWTSCVGEGGTCVLPAGSVAVVRYGAGGRYNFSTGMSNAVGCNNSVFSDPTPGVYKYCDYVVTSGSSTATGAIGPFVADHFTTESVTPGCGTFTYSGQPFGLKIYARNASGGQLLNYDGTADTSPNFAKAVTLTGIGLTGALSNASVVAASFDAGVATIVSTPVFTFTNKLTAAGGLTLRAADEDASSNGQTEAVATMRSGRVRLSNAFGSEKTALAMAVQTEYWSGSSWVRNSADSCTTIPASAVALSNYTTYQGTAAAWTTTAGSVSISGGNGVLTLTAPSPALTGSVDVALNLGSTSADNACLGAHPSTTGASRSWLRSRNGNCDSSYDRDPSARASFGIYTPESRRMIHVRPIQ